MNSLPSLVIAMDAVAKADSEAVKTTKVPGLFLTIDSLPRAVMFGIDVILNGTSKFKAGDVTRIETQEQLAERLPFMAMTDEEKKLNPRNDQEGQRAYVESILDAARDPALRVELLEYIGRSVRARRDAAERDAVSADPADDGTTSPGT
jgi:hypothetical protein